MSPSNLVRRLFCRHRDVRFVRNIHGDEINHSGGKRSVWRCQACGAAVRRDQLHTPSAPPVTARRSYAQVPAPASSSPSPHNDMLLMHAYDPDAWRSSKPAPEPDRFVSNGGGDFGGGGASSSWSSSCDSSSSAAATDSTYLPDT